MDSFGWIGRRALFLEATKKFQVGSHGSYFFRLGLGPGESCAVGEGGSNAIAARSILKPSLR